MKLKTQYVEKKAKQLIIATFVVGSLAIQAFAQTALPTLPALPGLPIVPAAPSPGAIVNDSIKNTSSNTLPSAPKLSAMPTPVAPLMALPKVAALPPLTGGGIVLPPSPEATDTASTAATDATTNIGPLPSVTSLPEINVATTSAPALPDPVPAPGQKLIFPKIKVVHEKAPPKTWETALAPSIIPVQTNFNYKRQVLPETLYRSQYSRENSHLPRRETHEEYEGLLFTSIARHDMDATRALLRAGTNINAVNGYGETPRSFASRIGAADMAALLAAHGGI